MKAAGGQDEPVEGWREARRGRILSAATMLFATRGFAEVQMDDVARLAGMGKPTLYRYFPSKSELFVAAFDGVLDGLEVRLEVISASDKAPPDKVAGMVDVLVTGLSDQIATLRYLEGESPDLAGRWRQAYRRRRQSILRHLERAIVAGQDRGLFGDADAAVSAALVMGMVRGGLTGSNAPVERIAETAKRMVLSGLARMPN